jgi:hypothetical protein
VGNFGRRAAGSFVVFAFSASGLACSPAPSSDGGGDAGAGRDLSTPLDGSSASIDGASDPGSMLGAAQANGGGLDAGPLDADALDGTTPGVAAGASVSYGYFFEAPADTTDASSPMALFGVPAGGGTPVILTEDDATHQLGRGDFETRSDASHVYFVSTQPPNLVDGAPTPGFISSVPLGGGPITPLGEPIAPVSFAVHGAYIYALSGTTYPAMATSGNITRVPIDGGAHEVIANLTETVGGLAVDDTYVYWTQSDLITPTSSGGLIGEVMRMPLAGGAMQTLAHNQVYPGAISVDSGDVYWLNTGSEGGDDFCSSSDGTLMKLAAGTTTPVTLATQLQGAIDLTVQGGRAYFVTTGAYCKYPSSAVGSVFEYDGSLETRAMGLWEPNYVVVDATTLYFESVTNLNNRTILIGVLPR